MTNEQPTIDINREVEEAALIFKLELVVKVAINEKVQIIWKM